MTDASLTLRLCSFICSELLKLENLTSLALIIFAGSSYILAVLDIQRHEYWTSYFRDSVILWVRDLALWPVPAVRQESWWLNCTCFVLMNVFPLLSLLIIGLMIKLCRTKIPHLYLFSSKLSGSGKSFLTCFLTFIMQIIKQVLTIYSLCGSLCLLSILGFSSINKRFLYN